MEEKLFKFIQDTIEEVTGKKGLVMDTDFVKDLGLNSFDIMNVVWFTVIFAAIYAVVWITVVVSIKMVSTKLNKNLK